MSQSFGLNYNSNFYTIRDSNHVSSGMDCLQLQLQPQQVRTQPFHYLINEQAKSLLALQELQNEVGALLEFRDLVMETFPNLRHKMSGSGSSTFSNAQTFCSNSHLPLSNSLNSRHWEPGIKVKRKIVNKGDGDSSFVRVRSNSHGSKLQSSQPKSSEAISGVQDSGFSTETNSSNKDHASSTATSVPLPVQSDDPFSIRKENHGCHKDSRRSEYDRSDEELSEDGLILKVNEAEEELWNLLDVIHTKGTKLREEVETLQLRLMVEEVENHLRERESDARKVRRKFSRRCRSLDGFGDGVSSMGFSIGEPDAAQQPHFKFHDLAFEEDVFGRKPARSMELEDVDRIRQERNMLLDKLAEMETENMANRIKNSELQNEISALISTKKELQEQLFQAVKQKTELNSRIHELHLKFLAGDKKWRSQIKPKESTDSESSQYDRASPGRLKTAFEDGETGSKRSSPGIGQLSLKKSLGALDRIVNQPRDIKKRCKLSESSKKKLEAILKEKNYLELQRHLLISVVQNQILSNQLETSMKSKDDLSEQLDRCKKENDELLFQLEEKNIELEGTRAQVRVLEKLQARNSFADSSKPGENFTFLENEHLRSKGFSESEINRARQIFLESQNKKVDKSEVAKILNRTKTSSSSRLNETHSNTSSSTNNNNNKNNSFDLGKVSNVIPILALPLPAMTSHQSSGTESTQALEISSELEADLARMERCDSLKNDKSPYRRRPSKIPLNIQKAGKSLKSGAYAGDGTSLKKSSLDNLQTSLSRSSPCQNPVSMKYSSVGRTGSQLSIASQKSQASTRPKKSLTRDSQGRDELNSLGLGKNMSLKQTTNFSGNRQRDTLTRKSQAGDGWDGGSGKKGNRSSLRESFRSKISIDGNVSSKRESSMSGGRRDSFHVKQSRSNAVQQKTNSTKSVLSAESDNTKFENGESGNPDVRYETEKDDAAAEMMESKGRSSSTSQDSLFDRRDTDSFTDSLNSSAKAFAGSETRRKMAQGGAGPVKLGPGNVWNCSRLMDEEAAGRRPEAQFFDSIEYPVDSDDADDSLLINSSYYFNKSVGNEAMAELDSLDRIR